MVIMKALKCKTLGASVMYIHCTLANIHVYTCIIIFIIHSIIMHTRQLRECTGKYTEIWQRQKL